MNLNKYIATKKAKQVSEDGNDLHELLGQALGVKKPKGIVDTHEELAKKAAVSPLNLMRLMAKHGKMPKSSLQGKVSASWSKMTKKLEDATLKDAERTRARAHIPTAPRRNK